MNTPQPIPLLYSGQAGTYFGTEYESLPIDVHPTVAEVGQLLADRNMVYLGKLTCSQFSDVEVYAYASADQQIALSIMAEESGLSGIDCISKFVDDSFLTTTTVRVIQEAYEEQGLFRVSIPGLNVVELLTQHLSYVKEFEKRCGQVQPIFENLLAIAKIVDEYTMRQQANPGHGFLQFASGLAVAGVSQAMEGNEEDEDDDDEEYDLDRVEYDEDNLSPFIQAILNNDLVQVENFLKDGAELNPSNWDEGIPLVAAVYNGNPIIIQTLIAAGADLDKLDTAVYVRPIDMAIKQNRLDLVKLLLDAGASPEGGELRETGLAAAIKQNNLPILQLLLESGADPNMDMEDDYRPIMSVALSGRLDMVKCLVEYGADVNAWSEGETAVMSAARNAHQAVYDYLYPLLDDETRRYADKQRQKKLPKPLNVKPAQPIN